MSRPSAALPRLPALLISAGLTLALAGGCGEASSPEPAPQGPGGGKTDRIDPVDSENLGYLLLQEPEWPAERSLAPTYDIRFRYRQSVEAFRGEPLRVTAGEGCLDFYSSMYHLEGVCGVDVARGQTLVYGLAGLAALFDTSDTGPLAVDFGPRVALSVAREEQPLILTGTAAWSGAPQQNLLVPPGRYVFDFGVDVLEPREEELRPAEAHVLDLTPPDRRAFIRVVPPQRDFPDAAGLDECEATNRHYLVQRAVPFGQHAIPQPHPLDVKNDQVSRRSQETGIVAFRAFTPPAAETGFRVFPFTEREAPMHYEYVVNNQAMPLEVAPGETVEVPLRRIDVNDVAVTREDGNVHAVQALYHVERRLPDGSTQPVGGASAGYHDCSGVAHLPTYRWFRTPSGLDVLPGQYVVTLQYGTAEGNREQVFELDLR